MARAAREPFVTRSPVQRNPSRLLPVLRPLQGGLRLLRLQRPVLAGPNPGKTLHRQEKRSEGDRQPLQPGDPELSEILLRVLE